MKVFVVTYHDYGYDEDAETFEVLGVVTTKQKVELIKLEKCKKGYRIGEPVNRKNKSSFDFIDKTTNLGYKIQGSFSEEEFEVNPHFDK